jgi:uncharacterized repeat protein (TIGR01451 family)
VRRPWSALAVGVLYGSLLLGLAQRASADPLCAPFASGGSVSLVMIGGQPYCVHEFTTLGTSSFALLRERQVEYLVIGGGGGGGAIAGGGGGGGGFLSGIEARAPGDFTVTVGAGGLGDSRTVAPNIDSGGGNGGDSSVFGLTARGGGGGGTFFTQEPFVGFGRDGGSGGGSSHNAATVGQGELGQGTNGATGTAGSGDSSGGGGGGAGQAGFAGSASLAGRGGDGMSSAITGSLAFYAGGGAGGGDLRGNGVLPNSGGAGGGGASSNNAVAGSGSPGTGGGGAGGRATDGGLESTGGNGGSGIVILRYAANTAPQADAGPAQTVTAFTSVSLDGTNSTDPDDNIASYSWNQLSGPEVLLTGSNTVTPSFTAPQPSGSGETLIFRLTVTDDFGLTDAADVSVTVTASPNEPQPGIGGTVNDFNDPNGQVTWRAHSFFSNGTLTLPTPKDVEYLVVGGGGGAGTGGGGGGGVIEQLVAESWAAGDYNVTVGQGGAPTSGFNLAGLDGGASSITGPAPANTVQVTAFGGGGGGRAVNEGSGRSGGSGGGAARDSNSANFYTGGSGTAGQGNSGANNIPGSANAGGGGGGAGGAGSGINGGSGRLNAITGSPVAYAGGGASASGTSTLTDGANGAPGARGSGGDHGEQFGRFFDAGQAGVVILRYVINTRPMANAGLDAAAIAFQEFTLDGTGSTDPDGPTSVGNIVSYAWQQINIPTGGTAVALTGANTAQPSFTPPQPANGAPSETLTFELTVTDAFGLSQSSTVTITLHGVAVLTASKTVSLFSEDGNDCGDFSATTPEFPAAIPGACIQYTISVTNDGSVDAENVSLTDALPANLSFQAAGLSSNWGSGATLNTPATGCSGCEVSIENGVIAAEDTATLTIRAIIN